MASTNITVQITIIAQSIDMALTTLPISAGIECKTPPTLMDKNSTIKKTINPKTE